MNPMVNSLSRHIRPADDRNRAFCTAVSGKVYDRLEEILNDWNDGKEFRLYQGYHITKAYGLKLKLASFTHVTFVWQDRNDGNRVMSHDLEL